LQLEPLETRIVPVLSPATNGNPVASSFVPAVGEVTGTDSFTGGQYHGTGTLIADRWVLTASHVVSPSWTEDLRFNVNGNTYMADARYGLNPLILGTAYLDPTNYEIGLIHLTQSVPGVTPVPIWRGGLSVGQSLVIVGYGRTDNGTHTEQANTGTARRAGILYVDGLPNTNEGDQTLIRTRYGQDANGAFSGHGDSGGPYLLYNGGRYYVAGVVSHLVSGYITRGDDTFATTGTVADALRVAPFGEWLDNVMRTSSTSGRFAVGTGGPQGAGVQDTTAPVISPIQDIFIQSTNGGTQVDFPSLQVGDNYDLNPSVVFEQPPGTLFFSQTGAVFPVGTTTVTVTATDASGNRTTAHFNVVITGPPTPQTPFLDQAVTTTTPTFTWSAVSGAMSYSVSVVDAQTHLVVASASSVSGTSWTPSTPLTDGRGYEWQVTAYTPINGSLVASKPSNSIYFFVNVSGALNLTSPAPGSTVTTGTPTLQWTPIPGAFTYKLSVYDVTTGTPVVNTPGWTIQTSSWAVTVPLPSGHNYQWTVTADDTAKTTASAQFTIAVPGATGSLAAPTLSGPAGLLTTGTPTFQWSSVPGATGYGLYIVNASNSAYSWKDPIRVSGTSYTPTSTLNNGFNSAYQWWVTAYDNAGNVSPLSQALDFGMAVPNQWVPATTPAGPTGTVNTLNPTFQWSAVSGAEGYYLSVIDESLHTVAFNRFVSGATSYTLGSQGGTSLLNGHTYRWYIAALTINGLGPASTQTFTTAFPGTPTPVSPGGLQPTTTPTLEWSAGPGAAGYYLTLTDLTNGRTLLDSLPVSATSYTLRAPLSASDTYQWQVRAYAGTGDVSQASTPVSFTVSVNLAAPTLTPLASPVPTATPTLRWTAVAGAAGYHLHLVDTTTGAETVLGLAAPVTLAVVPPLADAHSYRWWVVAYDGAGNLGPAPAALTFTAHPLSAPTSLAPGGVVPGTPLFQWAASAGAASYQVDVFDVTAGEPIYVAGSTSVSGASYTSGTSLVEGHLYQWRVRAVDGAGDTSPWSTSSFTVGADRDRSTVAAATSSLSVGDQTTVTLTARDANGNQEMGGGLAVSFGLGNGSGQGTFGPVRDNGDGTYTATFTASVAGSNTITASINGQAVVGPASVSIVPGPASLSQSKVSAASGRVTAGKSTAVTLTARDANGNQETSGGLAVTFGLGNGSGQGTFGPVRDNGDGTYTATFTATVAGSNTITASINGQAVVNPALVSVIPGPVNLARSTISPATVMIARSTTVTLTARDAYGNQERGGGLVVRFRIGTGAGRGTFGPVRDDGNGTYTATFTATALGNNTINATMNGKSVVGSAPLSVIPGPVSLSRSTVSAPSGRTVAGTSMTVTLTARDANGNREKGGGLVVRFGTSAGRGIFGAARDNGNGTYSAVFTATTAGTVAITATIGGRPVSSKAASIVATPAARLTLSPGTLAAAKVGRSYSLIFDAIGGYGLYSFSLKGGSRLPAGLTLFNAGVLSGTPVAAGTYAFTLIATDRRNPALTGAVTYKLIVRPALVVPGQPTWSSAGGSAINLYWSPVAGATSYQVERWDSPTGSWVDMGTHTGTSAYFDHGLGYSYHVRAISADEVSGYGPTLVAGSAPDQPTWALVGPWTISLTWNNTGASSYLVQYWDGFSWNTMAAYGADVTSIWINYGYGGRWRVGAVYSFSDPLYSGDVLAI
jgi:hypothetical protein